MFCPSSRYMYRSQREAYGMSAACHVTLYVKMSSVVAGSSRDSGVPAQAAGWLVGGRAGVGVEAGARGRPNPTPTPTPTPNRHARARRPPARG